MLDISLPAAPSPIDLYVDHVEYDHKGIPLTIYILKEGLPRGPRMQVLAQVRDKFPGVTVSMIGTEVAVFAIEGGLGSHA